MRITRVISLIICILLLIGTGTASTSPNSNPENSFIDNIYNFLKHLIPASIIGVPPLALEYPTYTQSDTVPCTGKQCSGNRCWWPVSTSCYRAPEGNNIVLRSDTLNGGVFNAVYYICPNGAYDPYPNNGIIEAKCLGYCKPNTSICDSNILKVCNPEGTDIISTRCTLGCLNISSLTTSPSCVLPHTPLSIELIPTPPYLYGKDAVIKAYVIVDDTPYQGSLVTAKLLKDSGIISETSAYTQSDGYATLIFSNVEGIGTVTAVVTTTYLDKTVTAEKNIYFGGETIIFTPTTYSYIQYTAKPVEFTISISDIKGKYINPSMGTLTVTSTLSNSAILNSQITYLGNGQYKIISTVSGSGIYTGKVKLSYYGIDFESKGIQIDIRDTSLEINTAGITPTAFLNTTETITFTTTSSIGGTVEPDAITIDIQYPDGYTTKHLTTSDLRSLGSGIYSFNFTFPQLEKYTFNIYADKIGYTRGSSTISIAVSSLEEEFNYIGTVLSNAPIIALISLISIFIWYIRIRKPTRRSKR